MLVYLFSLCIDTYVYVYMKPLAQVLLAGLGMRLKKLCLKERLPTGFQGFRVFRAFSVFRAFGFRV